MLHYGWDIVTVMLCYGLDIVTVILRYDWDMISTERTVWIMHLSYLIMVNLVNPVIQGHQG